MYSSFVLQFYCIHMKLHSRKYLNYYKHNRYEYSEQRVDSVDQESPSNLDCTRNTLGEFPIE